MTSPYNPFPLIINPDPPRVSKSASGMKHAVDGRNPAPPNKAWDDDCPANTNNSWFSIVSKWCEMDSADPSTVSIHSSVCGLSAVVRAGQPCARQGSWSLGVGAARLPGRGEAET